MIVQAFTLTQRLTTDIELTRYWDVAAARMQGLEVEVLVHGSDPEDWMPILEWDFKWGRWRDYADGATFTDLDFDHPSGLPNPGSAGTVRSDWVQIWRTPLQDRGPLFTTRIEKL